MNSSDALWIFITLIAYLIGSIPFGRFIALKAAHIDITARGSGNIGATNVTREIGLKWGLLTLLLDVLKGYVPVFVFIHIFPNLDFRLSCVGLASLLGHQFSVFWRFRGGKGVATTLGIYFAISPITCLLSLTLFLIAVYITDIVSIGSICVSLSLPIFLFIFDQPNIIVFTSILMAFLICIKHQDNIRRLFRGEERKLRIGKKNIR